MLFSWERTLIAWLSTSALHTGSQKITRDAVTMFLCFHVSARHITMGMGPKERRGLAGEIFTDRPRAPCFNSIRRTRYVSEVSKVTIRWKRSAGLICELQSKPSTWTNLSASAIIANVSGEFENIRIFSSLEYANTWNAVSDPSWNEGAGSAYLV